MRAALAAGLCAACLLLAAPPGAWAQAQQHDGQITVFTFDRLPYYALTPQGEPQGFLLLGADAILRRAGFTPEYVDLPTGRVLAQLARSDVPACGVGWYRTPEREQAFIFSDPIYRDKPLAAICRAGAPIPEDSTTLEQLSHVPGLVFGLVENYSYGPIADPILGRMAAEPVRLGGSPLQLMRMLGAGRVDVLLMNPVEAEYLIKAAGLAPEAAVIRPLDDLPEGNERHVIFSPSTPPEVVQRVNAAIAAQGHTQ